jgi:hypothetical protein
MYVSIEDDEELGVRIEERGETICSKDIMNLHPRDGLVASHFK